MKNDLIRKLLVLAGMIVLMVILTGCEFVGNSELRRDRAIEDCKNAGGTPFVENYDDSRLRPIVHCHFGEVKNED